jgi:hypothetical protein
MSFIIQASSPKYTDIFDIQDENLSQAIETIFPLLTENLFIIWNTIHVPLSYKYDISIMLGDILNMIEYISSRISGDLSISWASDTFRCTWNIKWKEQELIINPQWENVVGNIEKVLSQSRNVLTTKKEFLAEWKKVINNDIIGLEQCGYKTHLSQEIERLNSTYNLIEEFGVLYKN